MSAKTTFIALVIAIAGILGYAAPVQAEEMTREEAALGCALTLHIVIDEYDEPLAEDVYDARDYFINMYLLESGRNWLEFKVTYWLRYDEAKAEMGGLNFATMLFAGSCLEAYRDR